LCSSRKYPYPPQERLTEIPRGRGFSKATFFKGKYEAKLDFPDNLLGGGVGGGAKLQNFSWEWY